VGDGRQGLGRHQGDLRPLRPRRLSENKIGPRLFIGLMPPRPLLRDPGPRPRAPARSRRPALKERVRGMGS
jgi:hypothetical protein